ncbi:MAG: hypothetical protein PHE83_04085 [Opitutaceae bacterium]|nr:hypothetical protein [Opitutaceae bacterium]
MGTGFALSYGGSLFGDYDYYGWPRSAGRLPYDDWPFYYERVPTTRVYPAVEPIRVVQPVVIQVGDGLRDARSPEQLRSIYGAQAEALIQRN